MSRLVGFLPRLVVLTLLWLLATTALTFAAGERLQSAPATTATATVAAPSQAVLVVPDVRRQAYVFAKGILQDAGFAWRVTGRVPGYATNLVAGQYPAPGARVVDTGEPTVVVQLAPGSYRPQGKPENASPYPGTSLRLADLAAAAPKPAAAQSAPPKPAATRPVAKPKPAKAPAAPAWPQRRPPAFVVPGARSEPLDEMPLPLRAQKLLDWLAGRPRPTDGNVRWWLYQHAWIVAGAREGWWHGADALRLLLRADARVWQLWGIGARSGAVARAALAEVEARSA